MNLQIIAQGLQAPFNLVVDLFQNKTPRIIFALGIISQVGIALAFYNSPAIFITGFFAIPLTLSFGPATLISLAIPIVIIIAGKILGCTLGLCSN